MTLFKVLLFASLWFVYSQANAETSLAEIKSLYQQGKTKQAYSLAQKLLYTQEGNPTFDLLFGKIAIDSGQPGQGVFALERVLLVSPDNAVARLELARGYYLLGMYDLAEQGFAKVEAMPKVPDLVKSKITNYRKAIKRKQRLYKTHTSSFAEFKLGYDSNVNSATAEETFTTPTLGTGTFSQDSLAQKAAYLELDVGANITHPLDKRRLLFAQAALTHRRNANHVGFDLDTFSLRGGLRIRDKSRIFRLIGSAQFHQLDHASYRYSSSLMAEFQHIASRQQSVRGYVQIGNALYPKLQNRDVYTYGAGLGLAHYFNHRLKPSISGMLYMSNNHPREDNTTASAVAEKISFGLVLTGSLKLSKASTLKLSNTWQNTHHQGQDATFLVARKSDYYRLGLEYLRELDAALSLKIGANYSATDSNISIYEYDRRQFYIGLRYQYD